MTRLIDADTMKVRIIAPCLNEKATISKATIEKWIDVQPTVDAVPVIWCEDCKYNHGRGGVYCELLPQMFGRNAWENYCSLAEPKETEQ